MNPIELLVEIIKEHVPEDIWQGSPLIGYRVLGNTNRGEIGEEFIRRYLIRSGNPSWQWWPDISHGYANRRTRI